jgi:hypothetical protein
MLVDIAIKATLSNPIYLLETPPEKLKVIKQMYKARDEERRSKEKLQDEYFEQLKAKCNTMDANDYRRELNNIFENMELYKLRYFYIFITGKLHI